MNAVDSAGQTPLHYCAAHGMEKTALRLLLRDADVDCIDSQGDSPLHLSARAPHEKLVRLFIEHAAVIARNQKGYSPRDRTSLAVIHDLLKLEELRQGFELRFDAAIGLRSQIALPLGPPTLEIFSMDNNGLRRSR